MRMHPIAIAVAGTLCVLASVLLNIASAQALEVHRYQSAFGGEGSAPGQLKEPLGIAVNDSTGDVYVVDSGNNRVQRFSATGVPLGQFNGSGTYEDTEELEQVKIGTAAPTGAFSGPTQVAVDNSGKSVSEDPSVGDVYVVDDGHAVIDKFSATGAYVGQLTGSEAPGGRFEPGEDPRSVQGVAVDPKGAVWVGIFKGPIYSFSDALANQYSSERETQFGGVDGGAFAVDAEDNIYFRSGNPIVKVNSSGRTVLGLIEVSTGYENPFGGELSDQFSTTSQNGVAVDPSGGEVYIGRYRTAAPSETSIGAFSLEATPIERFGSSELTESILNAADIGGVAVNTSDGTVYVTSNRLGKVSDFEAIFLPNVKLEPVSEQTTRSVTLNGLVGPEGKPVSSCVFEYTTAAEYEVSKVYAHSVPCEPGSLGDGTEPVPVSAKLEGLAPQSTYDYRLVAENVGGRSPTVNQSFVAGPVLGRESVSDVASSSATLQAPIDPNGADTHYYLEYGPSAAYGSYAPVAPPGVDLGSGLASQAVSVHLQNLEAGTAYHYRFVAVQDGESLEAPDHTFTTQVVGGAVELPDGRVWELVSPPDSNGALIELFHNGDGQIQAASDGSGIVYPTEGPSVGESPTGNLQWTQVLSRRSAGGWKTANLALANQLPKNGEPPENLYDVQPEYHLFSPDLSLGVAEPPAGGAKPLAPGITERTLYLRDDLDGSFMPLVTPANVEPYGTRIEEPTFGRSGLASIFEMHFVAATPDLSHVVLKTPMALTPEAFDEDTVQNNKGFEVPWNLYEWGAGRLQLVNILPSGEAVHGPKTALESPVRPAGMVSSDGYVKGGVQRIVSGDGARIAWTWGPYLYVRDMVEERTVRVGGAGAAYQTMNGEGSKIFYLENGDLYVYDFETERATDLTGAHGAGETSAGVHALVSDVSEDGSYVYFVASGVLADGGIGGKYNLYLLHDSGESWSTTHVATLSPEDERDWQGQGTGAGEGLGLIGLSSRVSPSGRYLEFMSDQSLTGYDNTDAVSGQPDEEVFLYDAQSGKLVCASCDPTGASPPGVFDFNGSELQVDRPEAWSDNEGRSNHWLAGSVPGWDPLLFDPATYQPRYLSNSGRLFFDSPVGLVPQDANGLEDVYEYEPAGIGNCTESVATGSDLFVPGDGGCVGLISSGTSSTESAFYDASENGNDVFFTTTARLSPLDYDKGYDVYDAHVCTSEVPCTPAPVSIPPCNEGESCKASPAPQPEIFGAPPSATFNGAGNITLTPAAPAVKKTTKKKAVKCRNGFTKKKNRCVKIKRAKRARKAGHSERGK